MKAQTLWNMLTTCSKCCPWQPQKHIALARRPRPQLPTAATDQDQAAEAHCSGLVLTSALHLPTEVRSGINTDSHLAGPWSNLLRQLPGFYCSHSCVLCSLATAASANNSAKPHRTLAPDTEHSSTISITEMECVRVPASGHFSIITHGTLIKRHTLEPAGRRETAARLPRCRDNEDIRRCTATLYGNCCKVVYLDRPPGVWINSASRVIRTVGLIECPATFRKRFRLHE